LRGLCVLSAIFVTEGDDRLSGFLLKTSQILAHLVGIEIKLGRVLLAVLPDLFDEGVTPSGFFLHRNLRSRS
jgi:hypothetical protein